MESVIEIEAICRKIFKESVLDIFYLIMSSKDITKSEIAQRFLEVDGSGGEAKTQKYRHKINESIAKLEGAMFIDSWVDGAPGAPNRYFYPLMEKRREYTLKECLKKIPI